MATNTRFKGPALRYRVIANCIALDHGGYVAEWHKLVTFTRQDARCTRSCWIAIVKDVNARHIGSVQVDYLVKQGPAIEWIPVIYSKGAR